MIGASVLALVLSLNGAVMPVSEGDIPYFKANPAVRAEVLRRCHADYALAVTRECRNAEAAGSASLGKPMPDPSPNLPWLKLVPTPQPAPQVPQTSKGRDRGA
jgi:hypothetical protein